MRKSSQLGSTTIQLRLLVPDGKKRLSNVLNAAGILELPDNFLCAKAGFMLCVGAMWSAGGLSAQVFNYFLQQGEFSI